MLRERTLGSTMSGNRLRATSMCLSLLYVLFRIIGFAGISSSRLDVTGIRHSRGDTQARQHPTHQHDVYCEKRNEPQPIEHKIYFLMSNP